MNKTIPTYQLNILSEQDSSLLDVFFLNQRVESTKAAIDIPYRTDYYGVGICIQGKAGLRANLERYTVEVNSIVAMSPHIIKQWDYRSDDFETLTILFTKEFISANNNLSLDRFHFFEGYAKHVFSISAAQSEAIQFSLNFLKQKYSTIHEYRNEILKNLINVLVYEVSSLYDQLNDSSVTIQSRSQLLTSEFKKLVNFHFTKERNVKFYAEKLLITPKHLTETVKEVTGKTAGEWIADSVILEAKVLLRDPLLNIAQISDMLCFADQSTFGKFFKNITTVSPAAYRGSI